MRGKIIILDEYDKRLLYELDKDAHMPISKLAKRLRRSKQFIEYRIKRLERNKVILGYHPIIDASKLGFFTYRIYFKFQQTTSTDEDEFVELIKRYENIWTITRMHGKWDYAFFLGVRTIHEFHDVWEQLMLKYKKNIKNYNVAIYAPIINFNRTFFTNRRVEIVQRVYGDTEMVKYDQTDFSIIKQYSVNVRIPLIKIAKRLNISLNTVRYRIRELEKRKIICGYKLDINLEAVGYTGYRVDLHLISTERNKELYQFCKHHRNIYQLIRSIGGADFEISVVVKDLYELLEIMNEMKERFRDVINDYEYFGFSLFPRLSFVPD